MLQPSSSILPGLTPRTGLTKGLYRHSRSRPRHLRTYLPRHLYNPTPPYGGSCQGENGPCTYNLLDILCEQHTKKTWVTQPAQEVTSPSDGAARAPAHRCKA